MTHQDSIAVRSQSDSGSKPTYSYQADLIIYIQYVAVLFELWTQRLGVC